MFARTLEH